MRLSVPKIFSKKFKQKCIEDTYLWVLERLNGKDGLGGIFPAMVNALIALKIDEKQRFKKQIEVCKKSINNLVVENKAEAATLSDSIASSIMFMNLKIDYESSHNYTVTDKADGLRKLLFIANDKFKGRIYLICLRCDTVLIDLPRTW